MSNINVSPLLLSGGIPSSRARDGRPADDLITPQPSATPTEVGEESSAIPETDTGSEFSAGFNEVIGGLHSLRRDDDQSSTITETSSVDDRESEGSHRDMPQIRQRRVE